MNPPVWFSGIDVPLNVSHESVQVSLGAAQEDSNLIRALGRELISQRLNRKNRL
jgi:hypothetical protein